MEARTRFDNLLRLAGDSTDFSSGPWLAPPWHALVRELEGERKSYPEWYRRGVGALEVQVGSSHEAAGLSHWGGLPTLPAVSDWPVVDDELMTLLLEIDLAELPSVPGLEVPTNGLLAVFLGRRVEFGYEPVVRYYTAGTVAVPGERRFLHDELGVLSRYPVSFRPFISCPSPESRPYLASSTLMKGYDENSETWERQHRALSARVGGYAWLGHGEMQLDLSLWHHEFDDLHELLEKNDEAVEAEVARTYHDWRCLFSFDRELVYRLGWHHPLSLFIQKADLLARRFEHSMVVPA